MENDKASLPEVRCGKCRRLLFYGHAKQIEIKCPKCGVLQTVKNC